jgi:putative oxygen-independent coproporphyrinogen III oxidase
VSAPARHLYLHLPFCAARCGYCAFVVEVGALEQRDGYLAALLGELERERPLLGPLDTVYLGGGTPTLMGAERLARLMERIRPLLAPGAEVSVEANPETVEPALLASLRGAGVTRLSLGVQSFQPHLLAALDRDAGPARSRAAFRMAREAGFESVSVDLLFGVPGQSADDLEDDIAELLALGPDHVSWYELELKPGSALARREGLVLDEEFAADAYERVVAALEDAGYRWYETANFARPGHECRHSLGYWQVRDYVGLGVGAVSTVAGRRWRNAPGLEGYLRAAAAGAEPARTLERLDPATRRRERWMLSLRLDRPLALAEAGPPDHPEALDRLRALGLLDPGPDGLVALSRRGRFLQNAVLHELMEYA